MKVCQYCDTVNSDEALVCRGCGAGEFYTKCVNCGKVFDGLFCPACGVKAGTEASVCPDCGRRYYTAACPHCGYSPAEQRRRAYEYEQAQQRALEKERQRSFEREQAREQRAFESEQRQLDRHADGHTAAVQQPKKRKHILLWILGWIFIFPLPLTILLLRKKSGCLFTVFKLGIVLAAWFIYLVVFILSR